MNKLKRLRPEDREDLVAYLDGELDEQRTRELDQVLAASEVARHEIEMLTRTWSMLETLPQQTASNDFASRTVASVKIEEQPGTAEIHVVAAEVLRRTAITLGWLAAAVAAAVGGFLLTSEWIPVPHEPLLRDLPIVENLDVYSEIGSVEFLRALDEADVLDEVTTQSADGQGGTR